MLLHDVVRLGAARFPDRPAVVLDGETVDHRDLWARVRSLGSAVHDLVPAGSAVAVLSTNRREYVECYYGVPGGGAVLTLLNYRLHPQEWAWILAHSGAAVLIAEPDLLARLEPLLPTLTGLRQVVVLDEEPGPGRLGYEELLDRGAGGELPAGDEHAPAWLVYTSGTTGRPKGALLTHRSLLSAAQETVMENGLPDGERYLTGMPLCHVSGYYLLAVHLRAGAVLLMRAWDPGEWMRLAAAERATASGMAPTMVAALLADPRLAELDLSALTSLAYGGAAMPVEVLRAAITRFGPVLHSGYAATELSGTGLNLTREAHVRAAAGDTWLLASCGQVQCLMEAAVLDPTGRECPPDVVGELAFRGEHLFAGYADHPGPTAESAVDGWFRSGDLARRDAEGFFYVVDRVKDMIITGGENVYSREVEDVLHRDDAVAQAAVVGVPDEYWGERVVAYLVARPDREIVPARVRELLDGCLARYKHPRTLLVVDALPMTVSGKVAKRELRERAIHDAAVHDAAVHDAAGR